MATYFSGAETALAAGPGPAPATAAERGELLFGTMDSWITWNLTGGPGTGSGASEPGLHVTDVTNASRTMLMNLETLDWDDDLLAAFGIPRAMLPRDPAQHRPTGGSPAIRWPASRSAR